MPRTKTRARQRRARASADRARIKAEFGTLLNQVMQAPTPDDRIAANAALIELLKDIAASDHLRLWSFVDEFFGPEDDGSRLRSPKPHEPEPGATSAGAKVAREEVDATKALIAQLIAPHLAGRPPRWVRSPNRAPDSGELDPESPDDG